MVSNTVRAANPARPTAGLTAAMPASLTTETTTPNRNTCTMLQGRNSPRKRIAPRNPTGRRPAARGPSTHSSTMSWTSGMPKPASPVMMATTQCCCCQVTRMASSSEARCTMPCTSRLATG
ncbi:Uncharacterised protein [Bordetella pertussis]|nr:Uncharacterised protein [Bordetella pertussis]